MEWVAIGLAIGVALWTFYRMPKIPKVTHRPGEIEAPICEEGAPIPVVFGTVCIKGANVTWWGGVETSKVQGGQNDGMLVYWLSMRMALCHGLIDGILKVFVGGKTIPFNPITADGRAQLQYLPILSGGPELNEMGGSVYFRMGGENIAFGNNAGVYSKPSEVNGESGGLGPGFFGIACVELERFRVGGNPYLEPWAFVVQRIDKRHVAAPLYGHVNQWLPEKRYIPHGAAGETKWMREQGSSHDVPTGDMASWFTAHVPIPDAWLNEKAWVMPFGTGAAPSGLPSVVEDPEISYGWENHHLWALTWIYTDATDVQAFSKLYLFVYCENAAWVWIDGTYVGTTNATNAAVNGSSANFDVSSLMLTPGRHTVYMYCLDEDPRDTPNTTYVYARIVTSPVVDNNVDAATLYSYRDMNPAHIIRECLSDPVWGLGCLDADIDDTSFTASANTLYQERFGISIQWNRPGSIEDFVAEICRHINGTLYLDRTTGKYKLTLVRELSSAELSALTVLDESNIIGLEDVSRRSIGELVNQVSVSYTSSVMGDEGNVSITEPGLVQSQGAVISSKLDFQGITTHDLASRVALRELRAMSSPALSCTVLASRKASSLNPGDAFKLTWSECGLSNTVMRVASIELGDGRTNRVRIRCIEDIFANVDENVTAPPGDAWGNPVPIPLPVPDPIFVDTYQYKSTFMPAKLQDPAVHQTVESTFWNAAGEEHEIVAFKYDWESVRPGVWRCLTSDIYVPQSYCDGVEPYVGMRVLVAYLGEDEFPNAEMNSTDKPRTGIYVFTDCGSTWNEERQSFVATYAQLERSQDCSSSAQLEDGCVVYVSRGGHHAGLYGRLTTTAPIALGTTALEWEALSSYSPIMGDNLLTEAQAAIYGDDTGATFNLSATAAEPGVWIAFPTMVGTPNAQTYPAGRTRWKFLASFDLGDAAETTTIECQIVKYVDINNVTVLAEAESDPITSSDTFSPHIFWNEYTTHADVNNDQTLGGGRLAVRYRLTTTSASQVVVAFKYGEMLYLTRVDTPLVIGETKDGFPSTPYGETIPLDVDGILTIPDLTLCSGEVRVSGSTFKGISITDSDGSGFVGGDKLTIRLTDDCYVHHGETVRAGAAGLDLNGSSGTDGDIDTGARSCLVLQYDDLIGKWELAAAPLLKEKA